jgi:hypothetical protein
VVNVAWPLPSREPVPSAVGPSIKVTEPPGVLPQLTVAVNVTGCVRPLGFSDDDTIVALEFCATICENGEDELVLYRTSPLYKTVTT